MLKHLRIHNLAIIDELALDFGSGFTVLTGETGAGKSILIDAIGLAAGGRADAALVRTGQEKAEIGAEFALEGSPEAKAWLTENELLDEDDPKLCVVRRVVYAEGRTRAFVNGRPVNAGQLRELGAALIEIFGQSESQTLLRADAQRELLDAFGGHKAQLDAVAASAQAWADNVRAIERLRQGSERDPAQLEFLRFQLRELEALALREDEIAALEAEHKRLANAGRLMQDGNQANELLYGAESSIYDQLATATALLSRLVPLHEDFRAALESVESAQLQAREAADTLRRVLDKLDLDPERLAEVERRLAAIVDLARKHRLKPAELPARTAALRVELDEMENAAGRLGELEQRRVALLSEYGKAAQALGAERRKAARRCAEKVTTIVRGLGMPHAQFLCAVDPLADDRPRAHGSDEVRFDFSANPGQPPRPLARVASGGELSRISLAIQSVMLQSGGPASMVFDEIDAGIGGGVAEIVGQNLRGLGARRQVFCVTHQAQVAAQGHAHFAIAKEVRGGQTYTKVAPLSGKERVEELARMQGGVEITTAALNHARELLKRASTA